MNLGTQLQELVTHVEQVREKKIPWQPAKFRLMAIDFAEKYSNPDVSKVYTLRSLMHATCKYFGVTLEQIRSELRDDETVKIRRFYVSFARKYVRQANGNKARLTNIGVQLRRHYSTVIHSIKRHDGFISVDDSYRADWLKFELALA